MKKTIQLLAVGAIAACALSAQASFSITQTLPTITIVASTGSQSGTLDFIISANGPFFVKSGTLAGDPASAVIPTGLSFVGPQGLTGTQLNPSSTSSYTALNANTSYTMVVDWTLSSATGGDSDYVDLDLRYNQTGTGTGSLVPEVGEIDVVPASVPEPAQTMAGAMLLGCGSLVFAGRRLFKKQTA